MDTPEAIATLVNLWPTSFKGDHWRGLLLDELQEWEALERRSVIDALKRTHNGKRIDLATLQRVRGSVKSAGRDGNSGGKFAERERIAVEWLATLGLDEAFRSADISEQIDIGRLVWVMLNQDAWKEKLDRQAGSAKYWTPDERIEHLALAAAKATINGNAACYPKTQGKHIDEFKAPLGRYEVNLPPLPVWFSDEDRRAGVDKQFAIGKRYGGMKLGNYGAIFNDPEYQAYLADYERRYRAAFEHQHGPAWDESELHQPATRPLDFIGKRKAVANQTTSPPTGSSDFDGCSDGQI